MAGEKSITERILGVLRPYAAHWGGGLGRGDLVIPQREIPRLVHELIEAVQEIPTGKTQATDFDIFQVLRDCRKLSSVQDQVERLKEHFFILKK